MRKFMSALALTAITFTAVAAQPVEPSEWAESSDDYITEPPSALSKNGYNEEVDPFTLNYTLRAFGRWLTWLHDQQTVGHSYVPRPVLEDPWFLLDGLYTTGPTATSAGSVQFDLGEHLRDGDVLRVARLVISGNSSADATVYIYKIPTDGSTPTTVSTTVITNPSSAYNTIVLTISPAVEFEASAPLMMFVVGNAGGLKIRNLQLDTDRSAL